jgi:hypothetical protein
MREIATAAKQEGKVLFLINASKMHFYFPPQACEVGASSITATPFPEPPIIGP